VAGGWKVVDDRCSRRHHAEAVVIVGTGRRRTAEIPHRRRTDGDLVEEGLPQSRDSGCWRAKRIRSLIWIGRRKTRDKAINILQGRCVGGGTTVNWTSSFRTPPTTLAYWREHFGLPGFTEAAMAPWFARMEARLSIAPGRHRRMRTTRRFASGAARLHRVAHDPAQREGR
jgi:choline dehydrogenase-like flavoprotein